MPGSNKSLMINLLALTCITAEVIFCLPFQFEKLMQRIHLLWGANDRILSLEVAYMLKA